MRQIRQTRHGYHGTKLYQLWGSIVKRCESKKCQNYKYYGGSGITICKEWRENPKVFIEWAFTNGYKDGFEIDRIDNTKGYSPDNCQFVPHKDNCAPGKRRIFSSNTTGHVGIVKSKSNTYEVWVQINGKQKYCGVFKTIDEAIAKRMEITGTIHDK